MDEREHEALGWGAAAFVLGLLAFLAAVLALLPLPLWATALGAVWLVLSAVALLTLLEAASRRELARSLSTMRFTQVYRSATMRQLARLWSRFCDPAPASSGAFATFRAALTWRLYDAALLVAVAYPFLLLVGWWLLGFDGRLGAALLLPATSFWPDRAVILGGFGVIPLYVPAARLAAASPQAFLRNSAPFLLLLVAAYPAAAVLLFAGVAAAPAAAAAFLVFLFVFAFSGAFSVAAAGIGALVYAFAGASAFSVTFAFAFAFTVAAAVNILDRANRAGLARALLTALFPLMWVAGALGLPWSAMPDEIRVVLVFLVVLPLLNSLFDVLSYAATLSLMRLGMRSRLPLIFGALDLGVALILFLALGASLTAVIAGLNRLAQTPFVDMGSLFAGIHTAPGDYWWLYAMVFSTILPTVLHAGFSLLGAQGLVPGVMRRPVARLVAGVASHPGKATLAPLAVGAVWTLPVLAVALICLGGWLVLGDVVQAVGWIYLDTLTRLAFWIGAF